MTEYEEICAGKSIDELKVEFKHQVIDLGYNEGDSFPSYIKDLVQTKRRNREPETYNIKFKGIDDWHHPVYKIEGQNVYVGDVNKLFDWDDTKETVDAYFKDHLDQLVIFGSSFNKHDPLGTNLKSNITLKIV